MTLLRRMSGASYRQRRPRPLEDQRPVLRFVMRADDGPRLALERHQTARAVLVSCTVGGLVVALLAFVCRLLAH